MNIPSIEQVLESPLPIKLIVTLGMSLVFLYVRRHDTEGHSSGYLYLFALQAVRDLAYTFLPVPQIYLVSDLFIFAALTYLVSAPFGVRILVGVVSALNLAAALIFLADYVRPFLPVLTPSPFSLIPALEAVALAALLATRGRSLERPLVNAGTIAVGFGAAYAAAAVFLGYDNGFLHKLAVPLFYFWPLSAAFFQLETHEVQLVRALEYYEGAVDSIYNLSVETGAAMRESFSISDMLDGLSRVVVAETEADGGAVLLVDEFEDVISVRSVTGRFPPPFRLPEDLPRKPERVEAFVRHAQFKLGETLFGEAARTGKPIFAPLAEGDGRIAGNGPEEFLRIGSLMAVPLLVEDTAIGVLAVERVPGRDPFTEGQFDHLKTLANFGALQISNFFSFQEARERSERERASNIAAEIQGLIIPKKLPDFPTAALGAFTAPAIGVSGDYFDIIQTRKDRLLLAVGDVAGKGVAAALVMVMVRSILHLVANTDKDVATMLSWINRGITGKIEMDHYATLGLVSVDLATGGIEYANAGHQPLLIFRASEDGIESVEMKSIPIGVERGMSYSKKTLSLRNGDMLLLYTDGVVESMNAQGRQFGRKNLGTSLLRSRELSARETALRIRSDLANFAGEARQHDDQTVLVMKMKL